MPLKRSKKSKKDEEEQLTKLHTAKTAHHVKKYLDRGMEPDQLNKEGDAPIHYYIKRKDQNRFECLMAFLIHTPRNDVIDLANSEGMTALHLACKINDILATKALIAFDADLNIINYDNCTPLDIAAGWFKSISEVPRLLMDLGGARAEVIKQMENEEDEGSFKGNPNASYFEEDADSSDLGRQEERTIRTRFGLDMQLMSVRNMSIDGPPSHERVPAMYYNLEFHDVREEVTSGGQSLGGRPVSLSKGIEQTKVHFHSPDASVEMALTGASVILAQENITENTPYSSVVSGGSVLRNNKFLTATSPESVSPHSVESPIERSTEEQAAPLTQEQLTRAYTALSQATQSTVYQPVTNPMSLEETDSKDADGKDADGKDADGKDSDGKDTDGKDSDSKGDEWVTVKKPRPHVHFAEEEEEDNSLPGYVMVNGKKYSEFKDMTIDKLTEGISLSPPTDEGYSAWLQWREMIKAKKRKEEIRKLLQLPFDDTVDLGKPPKKVLSSIQVPPPKPFTVRHPDGAAPVQRRHRWRQRQYLQRQHSSGPGSLSMMKSLVNPSVAVHKSILGSSVAPFMIREERGERILCLDGGGIKGLIQIEILKHIEAEAGRPITELFDWIVGTSTGGIVALGLVYAKRSLEDLKKMYFELKDTVFKRQSKVIPTACDTDALEELLKKTLGEDLKMNSVKKPKVLVLAVDKRTSELPVRAFNNCFNDDYSYQHVWQVARYTSAAPLYFRELDNYVDGGVKANNPGRHALFRIQKYLREQASSPYLNPAKPSNKQKNHPKSKIGCLLSIGCGKFPSEPIGNTDLLEAMRFSKLHNAPQMLSNLVNLLTSTLGQSEEEAEHIQSSCEEQEIPYYRFSPELGETVGTAETDNLKLCELIIGAKRLLVESQDHIAELIKNLNDQMDL